MIKRKVKWAKNVFNRLSNENAENALIFQASERKGTCNYHPAYKKK